MDGFSADLNPPREFSRLFSITIVAMETRNILYITASTQTPIFSPNLELWVIIIPELFLGSMRCWEI